jgi:hypothetical protein
VTLTFALFPDGNGTPLQLLLGNMHDTAVRGHMDFHWDMTLPVLKRYCEATRARRACDLKGTEAIKPRQLHPQERAQVHFLVV